MRARLNLAAVVLAATFAATPLLILRGQAPASTSDAAARVARIEQGLLPPVTVKDAAPAKYALQERMAFYKVPAISIAFVENGTIAWAKAYGVADVAAKTPATTETLFQAASISKPLTALAVMRLVQDGKLTLDEDVNVKLKSWKLPENEFTTAQKVTLRRLLTHSGGTTVSGFPGYTSTEVVPSVLQVLNGEKPANTAPVRVDIEPGTITRYSGGGFTIVQLLLSNVTGKPFSQLMREMVLAPAGMTASTYEQPLPSAMSPRATMAYLRSGEPVKGGPHTYPEMAAAGLWTTPSEISRVAIEMEASLEGRSSNLLSQATIKEMLSVQREGWGLGIGLNGEGPSLRFGHSGANAGYRCQWLHYPGRRQGVAVMTNADAGSELIQEVLRAIAAEYGWPDFKPVERTLAKIDVSVLPAYAGSYRGDGGLAATVTHDGGRLFMQAAPLGPKPVEIHPESATDFFVMANPLVVRFTPDGESMTVLQGPNKLTLKRVKQ